MESKANYTVVGTVVVIITVVFVLTALWLSIGLNHKEYKTYLVYLDEPATGLNEDSQVNYNGVKIGIVKAIKLCPTDPQKVIVLLSIYKDTLISTSTYATLVTKGITGVSIINLSAYSSTLTPLKKQSGEKYPVIPSKLSFFTRLEKTVDKVSHNVEELSETLAKVSRDFPVIVKDMKSSLVSIKKMASDVSEAGVSVTNTMNSGKLTIDQISQQTIPSVVELLRKLNNISSNLETVSTQMKQNPSVVIRGTKPPKPGPGE